MRLAKTNHLSGDAARWVTGRRIAIVLLGFAIGLTSMRLLAQGSGMCADTASSQAKHYRDYYKVAASSSASHMVAFRSTSGVPNLAETQVRFVSDTAACRVASAAVDSQMLVKYPDVQVLVIELGTKRLVIKDISILGGFANYLFNADFSSVLFKMVF